MKYFVLKMTREQDLLLAKHLGELGYMYRTILELCNEKGDEQMKERYQTYLKEVNELIDLMFTVFKKENMVEE